MKGELVKLQLKKNSFPEDGDFKKIIRRGNEADTAKYKENKELEVPTMYKARTIALELGLSMKLSDVEYQGDRRKATFYYTAEDRVDFRELIKRLADSFKVRIEMRQIGYRQEAGRLGAIGSCGRELCCSTWLTDFKLVNTTAARYQNLSINQLKLSGQCGKLKCCLNYELDSYLEALKDFPEENNLRLDMANGTYKLIKTDILKRLMLFVPEFEYGGEWLTLKTDQVRDYIEKNKQGIKPEIVIPVKEEKVVELEFKNDMGADDINRMESRNKNNRNKPAGDNPAGNQPQQTRPRNEGNNPENKGGQQQLDNRPPRRENSNPEGRSNQQPRESRPPRDNSRPPRRENTNPESRPNQQPRENKPRGENNNPAGGDRNRNNRPNRNNRGPNPNQGDRNKPTDPNPKP
jgi:cell fate regulator YaaT (PSP1 superfamily)